MDLSTSYRRCWDYQHRRCHVRLQPAMAAVNSWDVEAGEGCTAQREGLHGCQAFVEGYG